MTQTSKRQKEGLMIVGYARTSTIEQEAGFEAQVTQLEASGVEKVFSEQVSAVAAQRPELEAALDFVRAGDCFVVTKLDRLARSVPNLCDIAARLEAKGVQLKVLDMNLDTSTPTGRLMFNIFGSVAQFERELTRERMLVGIAKAKAEGKYKGRAPTARAKAAEVKQLYAEGVGPTEIAKRLRISRASVYRALG
jgi:DNA invertase Pin-like site-specific DNA recombinase